MKSRVIFASVWSHVWLSLENTFIQTSNIQTIKEFVEYFAKACCLLCHGITIILQRLSYCVTQYLERKIFVHLLTFYIIILDKYLSCKSNVHFGEGIESYVFQFQLV